MIFVLLIGANASTMKVFAASFIVTFSSNTAVSPTMTSLLPVRAITGKSPEGYEHTDAQILESIFFYHPINLCSTI